MARLNSLATIGFCLLASSVFADDGPSQDVIDAAHNKIQSTCQSCHGTTGDSIVGTFPRLNGQQKDYLVKQLKAFRDHSRNDPHAQAYMWGMASTLDNAIGAEIARYFAEQKATLPARGGELAAAGEKIFRNGIESRGVPPCAACHGDHGEGNGEIPRIAGQHGEYLKAQLEAFRALLRNNDVMHANTKDMTDSDIEAIVSFLAND